MHPQHILLSNLIITLPPLDLSHMILKFLAHADSLLQMRILQRCFAKARQLPGRGDGVADLSPIRHLLGQSLEVDYHVVEIDVFSRFF